MSLDKTRMFACGGGEEEAIDAAVVRRERREGANEGAERDCALRTEREAKQQIRLRFRNRTMGWWLE